MKAHFTCILLFSAFTSLCQEIPKNFLDSILKNYKVDSVNIVNLPRMNGVEKNWTRTGSTKYGIVYALPVDNMPCIVPNMEEHTTMPNLGSKLVLTNPVDPGIYSHPFTPYRRIIPMKRSPSLKFKSK